MLKVKEIMTSNVVTLEADCSIAQAREMMAGHCIRHLPVVDQGGVLAGVVTQRDILRAQSSSLLAQDQAGDMEASTSIEKIMSRKVKSVHPQDCLRAAGLCMQQQKIGCLPVVESGKLVGIITDSDFVGVAITLIEEQDFYEEQGLLDDDDF